jgi:hypothetical protein
MTAVTAVTTNFQPSSALPSSLLSESLHADPAAARAGHPSVSCPRRCPNVASPASHRGVVGCGPWARRRGPGEASRGRDSTNSLRYRTHVHPRLATAGLSRRLPITANTHVAHRHLNSPDSTLQGTRKGGWRGAPIGLPPPLFPLHPQTCPAHSPSPSISACDQRPATCDQRAPTFVLQHGSV